MRGSPFSAKAEYACVAMLELAARHSDPQPVRLKSVADVHRIPQRFLVQILLQLKASGLIVSTRGASGGYRLGRPPSQISLADIIGVIDRTSSGTPLTEPASPSVAVVRAVWRQILSTQEKILTETTLADLLERTRNDEPHIYQI